MIFYYSAPSTPPTNIRISSVTSTQFLLSWSSPLPTNQNGVIRNYTINILEVNTNTQISVTSQATSQLLETLHPYYNYSCVIAAVTVNFGPYSESINVTTLEDGKFLKSESIFPCTCMEALPVVMLVCKGRVVYYFTKIIC